MWGSILFKPLLVLLLQRAIGCLRDRAVLPASVHERIAAAVEGGGGQDVAEA